MKTLKVILSSQVGLGDSLELAWGRGSLLREKPSAEATLSSQGPLFTAPALPS